MTFPAVDYDNGELLSGLGVPDVRGPDRHAELLHVRPFFSPRNKNEFSVELVRLESNTGTIRTEVFGPVQQALRRAARHQDPDDADRRGRTGRPCGSSRSGSATVTLKPGEWSRLGRFTFPFNPLVKVTGIGRFHLASIDARDQALPLADPLRPARPAARRRRSRLPRRSPRGSPKRFGLFKTMGWKIDTWSMSEETIDERSFLEDVDATVEEVPEDDQRVARRRRTRTSTSRSSSSPTASQHVHVALPRPAAPAYDAAKAAKYGARHRGYLPRDGRDRRRGDGEDRPKDARSSSLSDHGFATWRRSMNYNTWLVEERLHGAEGQATGSRPTSRSSSARASSGRTSTGRRRGRTRWGSATSTST